MKLSTSYSKQLLFILIGISIFLGGFVGGYIVFGGKQKAATQLPTLQVVQITPIATESAIITPTVVPTTAKATVPVKVVNGSNLQQIKYTLPAGWSAKMDENKLLIAPSSGGGYLAIATFSYPTTIGRREYFCQLTHECVTNVTQFTPMTIGNISGYMATRLDNSGGGVAYFGAKGNTIYIITSYNPPSPSEFEKNYKQVMSSLVF